MLGHANWGVLDGVHIGATWKIQLNCLCTVVMQPYFDHLFIVCDMMCCPLNLQVLCMSEQLTY